MIPGDHVPRLLLLSAALAAMVAAPAPARAGQTGVIVPSYFYPGTGGPGGVGDGWAAMTAAAGKVPITAVLNPASGPGSSEDPIYANAMTSLENAGGKVVAYVFTNNGNAPLATVEGQINTYITQYGSLIKGFFLDGMFLLPGTLSYYQSIDSYIKSLSPSYTVIGNPGQPFLNGLLPTDYLTAADIVNIFEGPNKAPAPGAAGFDAYPYGLNWFLGYPSDRFSNIVFDVPGSDLLADLNKAVGLNAGHVYITDGTLPNPYSQLPSYWDQEVAAIHGLNSIPEPGSLALMAAGAALSVGLIVPWRRALGRTRGAR